MTVDVNQQKWIRAERAKISWVATSKKGRWVGVEQTSTVVKGAE